MLRSVSVAVLSWCAVAMLGGCSGDPEPVVAPPSAAVAPVPDDPAATEDAPGTLACRSLIGAVREGTLMAPGVVDGIVRASTTADAPIADSAQRLATAYAAAVTAAGTEAEPDAVAAVSAAGAELSTVCDESGLATAG